MAKVDNNIYEHERYKFKGLGEYKLPIEKRVNEICEMTKKEYPEMDNYLVWVCAVDYVMFDDPMTFDMKKMNRMNLLISRFKSMKIINAENVDFGKSKELIEPFLVQ